MQQRTLLQHMLLQRMVLKRMLLQRMLLMHMLLQECALPQCCSDVHCNSMLLQRTRSDNPSLSVRNLGSHCNSYYRSKTLSSCVSERPR
jgi:hypothetical protein